MKYVTVFCVIAQMTSVERILQYTTLDQEAPDHCDGVDIPPDWPNEGAISFQNIALQYLQDALPALSNVDFTIRGGEKVGSAFTFLCLPLFLTNFASLISNESFILLLHFKPIISSKLK